ncbi:MAG TPA: VOC family protein [Puia sp.]|jgi:PhnB protein|nr:VOC family protein [Puia sp.]
MPEINNVKNTLTRINTYLTFNGNCRDAMTFYKECLGGRLKFQTVGESPLSDKMSKKMKNFILHSTLTKGDLVLMGSDMVDETGLVNGNSVSIALKCSNESEIRIYYEKLSSGGFAAHPLELTYWGALFGDLTDKYGKHWLLNYEKNKKT